MKAKSLPRHARRGGRSPFFGERVESMALIVVLILAALAALIWRRFVAEQIVYDYQKGLLYRDGKFVRVLDAGRYRYLKHRARIQTLDLRRTEIVAPGQSILTKDNVNVKITLSGAYEIVDPLKTTQASTNYAIELYSICQLALRDLVAATPIDELLEKKTDIDAGLLAATIPGAERLGIKFVSLAVRDIVLPANLKKAFAAVLEAQKEAQRQLEQARGEQAVLRSLANSSKLYESNPALLQARIIQALSAGNNTIVFGADGKTVTTAAPRQ
jgi:regulator of protease activity HflC (stomatin/prohibitin superfamily)